MLLLKSTVRGLSAGVCLLMAPAAVRPAFADAGATRPPPTGADFARLEAQVNEQRQLIIQLMQNEQQRYDMLLKLISGQTAPGTAAALPPQPEMPAPPAASGPAAAPAAAAPAAARTAPPAKRFATVEGRVSISGGDLSDVYVFVDNVRGAPVRNRVVEIKQENKQFSPRLAVVQTGTQVVFPNLDTVYHNVFSTSPRNAFDLGSYRAGDKPRSVIMTAPGLVEIYCNVHQKMNANVMVVPNNLYAKVRADGSFRIDNVPIGARRLVAWSPNTRPANQKIEVTPEGGRASFALEYEEARSHTNKLGQPYGSYK
jgi:plastocyanin